MLVSMQRNYASRPMSVQIRTLWIIFGLQPKTSVKPAGPMLKSGDNPQRVCQWGLPHACNSPEKVLGTRDRAVSPALWNIWHDDWRR